MHLFLLHEKIQLIYLAIAIVSGALAAWLSVTARVKAALVGAANARTAMRSLNAKLRDAQREIVELRHQVSKLINENEELSGRSGLQSRRSDAEWEAEQALLEQAAARLGPPTSALRRSGGTATATSPGKGSPPIRNLANRIVFRPRSSPDNRSTNDGLDNRRK